MEVFFFGGGKVTGLGETKNQCLKHTGRDQVFVPQDQDIKNES